MAAMKAITPGSTVCLPWGRGGGKSYFQRLQWYLAVARWDGRKIPGSKHRGVRIVLLMPTLEQAKKVHLKLFMNELAPDGEWGFLRGVFNQQKWLASFPGGSTIQWVTSERCKNIRGLRADIVSVDECDDIDTELYDAVLVPWFTEPHSLRIRILCGTPTRGRAGLLYRSHARGSGLVVDNDGNPFENHHSFHATCFDFPKYVDQKEVEKTRRETAPELFAREYLCDFDAAEGNVYPHFKEGFHVREPALGTKWREYIIGVDWGFEDPAVFVVFGIAGSGKDVTIHQLDELHVRHKTDSDLAEYARRFDVLYPNARWYADPSRPQSITSLKREAGINIVGAENAIEDGVATVADTLLVRVRPPRSPDDQDVVRWAQMYVSPKCKATITEFGKYRRKRDPRNQNRILDDIQDRDNHCMDAIRYALFTHFGGPDKRIREGQRI